MGQWPLIRRPETLRPGDLGVRPAPAPSQHPLCRTQSPWRQEGNVASQPDAQPSHPARDYPHPPGKDGPPIAKLPGPPAFSYSTGTGCTSVTLPTRLLISATDESESLLAPIATSGISGLANGRDDVFAAPGLDYDGDFTVNILAQAYYNSTSVAWNDLFDSMHTNPGYSASTTASGGFWSTPEPTDTVPEPAAFPAALVALASMGLLKGLRFRRRKRRSR